MTSLQQMKVMEMTRKSPVKARGLWNEILDTASTILQVGYRDRPTTRSSSERIRTSSCVCTRLCEVHRTLPTSNSRLRQRIGRTAPHVCRVSATTTTARASTRTRKILFISRGLHTSRFLRTEDLRLFPFRRPSTGLQSTLQGPLMQLLFSQGHLHKLPHSSLGILWHHIIISLLSHPATCRMLSSVLETSMGVLSCTSMLVVA